MRYSDFARPKKLKEAKEFDYDPPRDADPNTIYTASGAKGVINKIVAFLNGYRNRRYNKLVLNLLRLQQLEEQAKQLKEAAKEDTKVLVASLFKAEDACCTRIVETNNFIIQISKDPEARTSYKYQDVLEELQVKIPELTVIVNKLLEKHKSVAAPGLPSIKITDKRPKPLKEFREPELSLEQQADINLACTEVWFETEKLMMKWDEFLAKLKKQLD